MSDTKTLCETFIESAFKDHLSLKDMRKMVMLAAINHELDINGGNKSEAARNLDINRATISTYLADNND